LLIDQFNRPFTHLRVSVTNRCNHSCIFCHREGVNTSFDPEKELSVDDWRFVFEITIDLGVKYYKFTGGEPLLRSDIVELVKTISELGGEPSLVTNGSLLSKYASGLANAGLRYVNVSLHSLNPEKFYRITKGRLDSVLNGIKASLENGIKTRLDFVVLSWNKDEYRDIIKYAYDHELDLNIIELIPLGLSFKDWLDLHVDLKEIISYLEEISVEKRIRDFQSRPVYVLDNGVEVTVIIGVCNPEMCMKCSRLRMTPEGYIKTCLYDNNYIYESRDHIISRDRESLVDDFIKATMMRKPFFKPGDKIDYEKLYELLLERDY